MKDLIEQLERASVPDRELDAQIQKAVGVTTIPLYRLGPPLNGHPEWVGGPSSNARWLPFYTHSIDAALTLVPEGKTWDLCFDDYLIACVGRGTNTGKHNTSPAIAICIAALKARGDL